MKELRKAFILLFTREQLPEILSRLGMAVDKRGRIVRKKTRKVLRCHICDRELTVENIGAIFPKVLICDNICCYSEYLVEKGVRQ